MNSKYITRFLARTATSSWFALCLFGISASPVSAWDSDSLAKLRLIADQGNAEAQYFVGMLYNLGIGGASRDPTVAFEWFKKSTTGNDPLGAYKVGCYYAGQFPDAVSVDADKALAHKLIAAKAGYSLAQSDVANSYFQRGDFAAAEKWWTLAATQGYAPAANNLSFLYFEGKGVPQDRVKSVAWFRIAYASMRKKMDTKAQEHLDKIARDMTPSDIADAEKLVSRWQAKPTVLTAAALYPKPRVDALLAASSSGSN